MTPFLDGDGGRKRKEAEANSSSVDKRWGDAVVAHERNRCARVCVCVCVCGGLCETI